MSLTSINLELDEVLRDPERRQEFFRSITEDDIAEQIRALRKERDLTQAQFAGLAGMKQSAVSRIEQAEYASWSWATLCRVAAALNARWRMVLQPCEDAIKEFQTIDQQQADAETTSNIGQAAAAVARDTAAVPITGAEWLELAVTGGAGHQRAFGATTINQGSQGILGIGSSYGVTEEVYTAASGQTNSFPIRTIAEPVSQFGMRQ